MIQENPNRFLRIATKSLISNMFSVHEEKTQLIDAFMKLEFTPSWMGDVAERKKERIIIFLNRQSNNALRKIVYKKLKQSVYFIMEDNINKQEHYLNRVIIDVIKDKYIRNLFNNNANDAEFLLLLDVYKKFK